MHKSSRLSTCLQQASSCCSTVHRYTHYVNGGAGLFYDRTMSQTDDTRGRDERVLRLAFGMLNLFVYRHSSNDSVATSWRNVVSAWPPSAWCCPINTIAQCNVCPPACIAHDTCSNAHCERAVRYRNLVRLSTVRPTHSCNLSNFSHACQPVILVFHAKHVGEILTGLPPELGR